MLDEDSPSHLARLLVGRAVDGSVDIPSRSHAVLQLVELVDSSQPWACDGEAQDECDEAADEAMASDEEEGDAHSRVRSHEACTLALLGSLPAASAASKPLEDRGRRRGAGCSGSQEGEGPLREPRTTAAVTATHLLPFYHHTT